MEEELKDRQSANGEVQPYHKSSPLKFLIKVNVRAQ